MPLTQAEFDEVVKATCKHCATGHKPRFRDDTNEYVHDFVHEVGPARSIKHTFCLATGIRKVFTEQQGNAQA